MQAIHYLPFLISEATTNFLLPLSKPEVECLKLKTDLKCTFGLKPSVKKAALKFLSFLVNIFTFWPLSLVYSMQRQCQGFPHQHILPLFSLQIVSAR